MTGAGQDYFAKVPAIRVEQTIGVFYAAAIPAGKLLEVCYSDKLRAIRQGDSYVLDGSQRLVNEPRLRDIGRYIDSRDAAFPNAVILAANYSPSDGLIVEDADLRWRIEHSDHDDCFSLIIPQNRKLAPIIDGQHRLFGFSHADKRHLDMPVLCAIFLDLPRPYQAYLFATINSTQKQVDRSQTYELFGYNIDDEPPEYWSPEKLAVFLTRKLNTNPDSPLYDRVRVAAENDFATSRSEAKSQERWMVSTATIVDGIVRLISTSPRKDADVLRTGEKKLARSSLQAERKDGSPLRSLYIETRDKVLLNALQNFFQVVVGSTGNDLPPDSYLVKTVGFQALFDALRILAPRALEAKDFSVDWFTKRLEGLSEIDFGHEAFKQASGQGRSQIRRVILRKIGMDDSLKPEQQAEADNIIAVAKFSEKQSDN